MAAYRELPERRAPLDREKMDSRALNRAKLQAEVLTSIHMVNQIEACELLGLPVSNPSAVLGRLESKGEILRFDWKGKAVYPLFQFDVSGRCVHPVLLRLIEMRHSDSGDNLAFLYWLTLPNRSLGGEKPCDRFDDAEDLVLRSYAAEISAPLIG